MAEHGMAEQQWTFERVWLKWAGGRVTTTSDRLGRQVSGEPSFTLGWVVPGKGFGELTFFQGEDGTLYCENELEPPAFVAQALQHFARQAVLVDLTWAERRNR